MADSMKVLEEYRNGFHILRITNPVLLEPHMADEMTKKLSSLFDTGAQKVIIDMGMVTRMTSLFFRSFIIAGKKAKECKAKMAFCNVPPAIKQGFEMMGFGNYFSMFPDETKAIENFGSVK